MADQPSYAKISEVAQAMADYQNRLDQRTEPDYAGEDRFSREDFWPQALSLLQYNEAHVDYVIEQLLEAGGYEQPE